VFHSSSSIPTPLTPPLAHLITPTLHFHLPTRQSWSVTFSSGTISIVFLSIVQLQIVTLRYDAHFFCDAPPSATAACMSSSGNHRAQSCAIVITVSHGRLHLHESCHLHPERRGQPSLNSPLPTRTLLRPPPPPPPSPACLHQHPPCLRYDDPSARTRGLFRHCVVSRRQSRIRSCAFPPWMAFRSPLPNVRCLHLALQNCNTVRMYSGFLNAGPAPGAPHANMNMHYVFIESERSPSTDPLIVWCATPLPLPHPLPPLPLPPSRVCAVVTRAAAAGITAAPAPPLCSVYTLNSAPCS
jgi:hypothetical protein